MFKDELANRLPFQLYSPSPKQYFCDILTAPLLNLPIAQQEKNVALKKAKGVKGSIVHTVLNKKDFVDTVALKKSSLNKVKQHRIQRKNRELYLSFVCKRTLTCLTSKRYFPKSLKSSENWFSLPLAFKKLFNSE